MTPLDFDIETIPSQLEWVREHIAENIKPPGNIKKPESIAKWHEEKAPDAIEAELAKTSFNGAVGEIICIGYGVGDNDIDLVGRKLGESEGDMIQNFVDVVASFRMGEHTERKGQFQWCGHYITGFDLHFLWQRCMVHNIKLPFDIPHSVKPWHPDVFDTCHEWKMDTTGFGSLDAALKCLNIPSHNDGDIDGSMVWGLIQAGEYDKVFNYCKGDTIDARALRHRLTGK